MAHVQQGHGRREEEGLQGRLISISMKKILAVGLLALGLGGCQTATYTTPGPVYVATVPTYTYAYPTYRPYYRPYYNGYRPYYNGYRPYYRANRPYYRRCNQYRCW